MKVKKNVEVIKQGKVLDKKLRFSKETIKELRDSDLRQVAGGTDTLISTMMKSHITCTR
jgi:hypothetical protein